MKKWLSKAGSRMMAGFLAAILFTGAGLFYVTNEFIQNKAYFLRFYKEEQELLTESLADSLETMAENNSTDEELLDFIAEHVQTSGSRYSFLAKDADMLFAKDKNSTKNLVKDMKKDSYIHSVEEDNVVTYKEFEYNNGVYTFGIVTNKTALLNNWKVTKHEIYTMLAFFIMSICFLAVSIGAIAVIHVKNRAIMRYKNDWIEQNKKLEQVSDQLQVVKEDVLQAQLPSEEKEISPFYDMDIVYSLLKKSDREELRPLYILFLKMNLADRYYSKNQMFDMVEPVRKLMKDTWIMAETGKGEFVILLYRTGKEEAEKLKADICDTGTAAMRDAGVRVRIGMVYVENQANALDVFKILQDKMKKTEG